MDAWLLLQKIVLVVSVLLVAGIVLDATKFRSQMLIRPTIEEWRAWRCRRARAYLLKHDWQYRLNDASEEVVRQREAFYARGGKPMDPDCPTLTSVLKERGDPLVS